MEILVVQGSKKENSGANQLMPDGIILYINFNGINGLIWIIFKDNLDNPDDTYTDILDDRFLIRSDKQMADSNQIR